MAQAEILKPDRNKPAEETDPCDPVASGLFGYSISDGMVRSTVPLPEYVRDLEQLPNFAPPSKDQFLEQYVESNIGVNESSS
ncbi:hypothetical protein [Sphingorhabdus sp. EL138]|jgi:hypothetical protein|uniref:hypothetical protein n=1 Tax=Sphingorhabdus sp. EL138 TaxID=2073156 RepID=UPI000D69FEDF|nr:hypothetical protein [Sphingorhabdus sp. EL138]